MAADRPIFSARGHLQRSDHIKKRPNGKRNIRQSTTSRSVLRVRFVDFRLRFGMPASPPFRQSYKHTLILYMMLGEK
jgi:hypothetical protein